MKYSLIGCGRISPNHIVAAINNNLEITSICDINRDNAEDKALKFDLDKNSVKIYSDYSEMLETEKPELVSIATESSKHAKIALDCIEAGCHVIIEKPIALSIFDADRIIEAGERKGVLVCACHQNRFNKSVQEIRKAIEKRRFGKLLYGTANIRWTRNHEYYDRASWRGTWEHDGGALMNQCIHDIDLLRWMMGDEIDIVYGMTDRLIHPYIEAEDFGIAVIKFKNGSYGIIEGTTDVYPKNLEETLYIFGEKGTVKAGGEAVNVIEEWRFSDYMGDEKKIKKECAENPPNVYGFGHSKLYKNVINSILNKEKLVSDGEAGKRAMELVLGIYKSAAEGVPVTFPLKDCSTMDFVGRFSNIEQ